jgi:hypothetical protein
MRYLNTVELLLASLAAAAVASGEASAETLYKLVAPNGKVTYVQDPPKNFDGKVIKLEIDTNANTAAGRRQTSSADTNEAIIHSNKTEASRLSKIQEAQAKAQAARKAYETARDNPGEGDVRRVGNVGGGTRPVFSEEYQKKLDALEAQMKQAQAELERLESGR